MSESGTRVAIVGAGIVGLAHAWAAARRGHRVVLFERDSIAAGASVRNFGMVWPIGQPAGPLHELALRSRSIWQEVAELAGCWLDPCGSLHLAHEDDEWDILREFAETARSHGSEVELLTPAQVLDLSPAVNRESLRGGLWSPTEAAVDPRQAIAALPDWLRKANDVEIHFDTPIRRVSLPVVEAADGRTWELDRVVVCSGSDFRTLFPDAFAEAGLRRCKLQMMKTGPQPAEWRIGPLLAGGLTLRHYANFESCASLEAYRRRIATTSPELDQYGIHVMASQNIWGEVILGDSHEYDEAVDPFDKAEIDDLILQHARRMFRLEDWSIAGRWHGIYAKHPSRHVLRVDPAPGVSVVTATGGAGMTLSFGLAEEFWRE